MTEKTLTIRSLRPNVTEADAFRQFESSGPVGLLRRARKGPLARLAAVYLPFQPYRVTIQNGDAVEQMLVAIEAVTGTLDLYQFKDVPGDAETIEVNTANTPTQRLDRVELEAKLRDRLRRTVFRRGFFALRSLQLDLQPAGAEVCVPYWVAFRGRGDRAHIEVLDAVRRSTEGSKVRRVIEAWLAGE